MKILYLLPFNNGLHFKIGITNDVTRLYLLDRDFSINFNKAEFVYSDVPGAVAILEKLLLTIWSEIPEEYKNLPVNGKREVRDNKIYKALKTEILNQNKRLKFKLFSYNDILNYLGKVKEKTRALDLAKKCCLPVNKVICYNNNYYCKIVVLQKELYFIEMEANDEGKLIYSGKEYIIADYNPLGAKMKNTLYLFNEKMKFVKAITDYLDNLIVWNGKRWEKIIKVKK